MYKLLFSSILILLLATSNILFAQNQFEGKVKFRAYDEGESGSMNYFVKGDKFRIDAPEGGMGQGYMIYDASTNIMTIVMVEQQMYMEMPVDAAGNMTDQDDDNVYFNNTGETQEINGYLCEKFEFVDEDGAGVAWMTQELGPFMFLGDPEGMGDSQSNWQQEIMAEGYFPMLVEQENSSGELQPVFEIEEILAMALGDDIFSIPAGFQKFDMPNMGDFE
ncbi:MAG: DUF4412 domain-containing protein [Ignavibacteriaceae bacterium]|nr:DUF4412 domain-containing protein [Ignavibacteriaceae bacterium]